MTVLRLTLVTFAATLGLLVVGRAAPGPAHHAVASLVGLLTIGLLVAALRDRRDRTLWRPALAALLLVIAQGAFGALTARGGLPPWAPAIHLALSLTYLTVLVYLAFRARAGATRGAASGARRAVVLAAAVAVAAQALLGAVVRHLGAGAVCGTDLLLCDGRAWPTWGPAELHMAHRYLGWAILLLLGFAHMIALREARRLERPLATLLARVAPVLVALQIGLGLWGLHAELATPLIAAHLAVGALLVANVVALHLALGPLGVAAPASAPAGASRRPGHAPGRVGEALS